MKVLVTGAKGFVGKNLCAQLNNIKTGKTKCYEDLAIGEVYEYDIDSTLSNLTHGVKIVILSSILLVSTVHKTQKEFMEGNFGFATVLLNTLKKHKNSCPVMISSSIQATLSQAVSAPASMVRARRLERNSCSSMAKRLEQKYWFIVSLIFMASGVDQTTIVL